MYRSLLATFILILALGAKVSAEEVSKEQIKGLDEQVQEIKKDVLGIAADLNRLEEKLLFPSNTQVSLFVTLAPGDKFPLDAVEILIDGKPVANHLYTLKELEALQQGGVQRIYTGNVSKGEHELKVSYLAKSGSSATRRSETFKFAKDIAPKLVGITLSGPSLTGQSIAVKDW